jgi:phage tail-like protein
MPESQNASQQPRTYAAAHFALELDGNKDVGLFRSIEGGGVKADVMTYEYGEKYERWRQLGKPKFEDIKLQIGMAMSKPFYDWIKDFFDREGARKNGAILAADFYYRERARREFTNALIKEVTFPKLDAQDKNAVYMNVTISPEAIAFKPGSGQQVVASNGMNAQKLWTACNFRLAIDGIDERATKRVTKIDSFTIKQDIIEYHMGGARAPTKTRGRIDYPNIVFYVPEADAQPLIDHFTKRAIEGEVRGHSTQRSGIIQTYDNEGKPLFGVEFFEADLLSVTPDKSDASSEEIKQVKFELYVEKMKFDYLAMEVV